MGFIEDIKKVNGKRNHKLKNSYDVRDYYHHYKNKYNTKLTEREYSAILSDIFTTMIDDRLLNFIPIKFPYNMGYVEPNIHGYKITSEDGEYRCLSAPDWKKTFDLWEKDEVAFSKRELVYSMKSRQCTVKYSKDKHSFRNQRYFYIKPARSLRLYLYDKLILNDNYNLK